MKKFPTPLHMSTIGQLAQTIEQQIRFKNGSIALNKYNYSR